MQTSPEVLHQDLADFRVSHPDLTLLQYADDILLTAETEQECLQGFPIMIMVHLLIEFLFSLTGLLELCLVFGCALDLCICFYESLEKSSVMLRLSFHPIYCVLRLTEACLAVVTFWRSHTAFYVAVQYIWFYVDVFDTFV
ncbi:hypothetical protein STEG23_036782 [Scotinomys teguina]